jgi:peptide methionine sulfoxide reductase MsrA
MKINFEALQSDDLKGKQQFLVVTQWPKLRAPTSYTEQVEHLRRAYDALQYMEAAFDRGMVLMAHKEASQPAMHFLVAVDNVDQLDEFLKLNPAHDRYMKREVIPMTSFASGHDTFKKMVQGLQKLADEERQASGHDRGRTYRPFPWDK